MTNFVLKCASRFQTPDLLLRITSKFGKMILHIKLIDKLKKIIEFGFWLPLWRHYWLKLPILALKRTSRVQTRDLFVRIISSFGEIISYIKTTDTYTNHKILHLNVTLTSLLILNGQFGPDMRYASQTKIFSIKNFSKLTLNFPYIEDTLLQKKAAIFAF